jgi:hypothetical protein
MIEAIEPISPGKAMKGFSPSAPTTRLRGTVPRLPPCGHEKKHAA